MDKSTNQMTDKDIQVLEEMRDDIVSWEMSRSASRHVDRWRDESTALTAVLTELRDTREMLDAATVVSLGITDQLSLRKGSKGWRGYQKSTLGWASITDQHDSALAAWRDGVKGEK